ncbi:helix-turn-helix domain-containing protein [Cellulophaga baltica]|uniref:DNA-binding transcriptional regulator, XRE-family HTH domain n=1 Tax=Cellulophaga baltica TaxID=76594 RepID=A0A1G7MDD1_9FLAO|nr:helix-turn-helix transcriptional regulator [Cellulophaga baltica]SDF59109.1 DNA-binding transcriptional regulator, XRE-family HTH domain [Cellulophaga baltica]
METATKPNHIGRKISRIRELRGMKQETLAEELGISQQAVSKIEQSEKIEEEKLEQIANVLGVPPEAIKNYSDEAVFNIMGNTYHDNASSLNYACTFNPIDKLVEVYEENKKLYERLLKSEQEKIAYLEKLMK